MIPVETLNRVTKIITHDHCPDGLASAIILLDAYWDKLSAKDVEFVSYNSERHNTMPAEPGMLFCDFSPPIERAAEFARAGTIVLDHHERERVFPHYGKNGVFSDKPGVSGAYLAYRDVWLPLREEQQDFILKDTEHPLLLKAVVEQFALLAGIRDTWQRDSSQWSYACAQAAALMFWPRATWLDNAIDWEGHASKRLPMGTQLYGKLLDRAREALQKAYEFTSVRGRRIVVISTLETSDAGDMLDRPPPPNTVRPTALLGFQYFVDNGVQKIQLSCRSTHDLDVKPFAKSFPGGGGHDRAAGFKIAASDSDSPYRFIEYLWNEWEEKT